MKLFLNLLVLFGAVIPSSISANHLLKAAAGRCAAAQLVSKAATYCKASAMMVAKKRSPANEMNRILQRGTEICEAGACCSWPLLRILWAWAYHAGTIVCAIAST